MADISRLDILEKVRRGEISEARGLALLKHSLGREGDDPLIYYTPTWVNQSAGAQVSTGDKDLLVVSAPGRVNGNLKSQFRNVEHITTGEWESRIGALKAGGFGFDFVLFIPGKRAEISEAGFISLFTLTKAFFEAGIRNPINLVYLYVNDSGIVDPADSGVSGFVKTLALENPKLRYKVVEIDSGADLEETALAELKSPGVEFVKYYHRQRMVSAFTRVSPAFSGSSIKEGGVYIITGGAGGLGLIFSRALTEKGKINLVLTGRSSLSREKERLINGLGERGASVLYLQSDVAAPEEAVSLIREVKARFGRVDGIIHSAGINIDSFFVQKTMDQVEKVLAPKVRGTLNLDRASAGEDLDFFVLFSSITSAVGNTAQTDYAYANAFLDNFAEYRNHLVSRGERKGKTFSINWPLWRGGGMQVDAAAEERLRKSMGMVPLDTEKGVRAFFRILGSSFSRIGVIDGDYTVVAEKFHMTAGERGEAAVISPADSSSVLPETQPGIPDDTWREEVENRLLSTVAALLKVKEEEIDKETELVEYGVSSIMMISLLNKIEEEFNESVSPNAVADYKTISALAGFLIEEGVAAPSVSRKAPHQPVFLTSSSSQVSCVESAPRPRRFDNYPGKQGSGKVAIISMACRLPGSPSPEAFWDNLKNGRDLIRETPPDRWDVEKYYDPRGQGKSTSSYSKWAGYVEDIDLFDAAFFGIKDTVATTLDPQHRIILELTQELFDRAGYTKKDVDNSRTSVYLGGNEGSYIYRFWDQIPPEQLKNVMVNRIQNMMAARVSDFYNLRGASLVIDTACSSSLVAMHEACRGILEGEMDMAVVGGVDLIIGEYNHIGFSQSGALSREPKSYVFDERAGGFVLGEGAGLVLLKDYGKALADGDRIEAVILATAVNNDGHTMGLTVPDLEGQKEVLASAIERSGINPETITYYEAHGTGTLLGDPIEVKAATTVYSRYTEKRQYCAIGSVKTNIGHLLRAAGISGVLKIILSMKNKMIPPTLNCEKPHPRFKFGESPFYPNLSLKEWSPSGPRRSAISSFGFGGTNAHVMLEEFSPPVQGYIPRRKSLPVTRFTRKRYWIGKAVGEAGSRGDNVPLSDEQRMALLEKLSRGDITPEEMLRLDR